MEERRVQPGVLGQGWRTLKFFYGIEFIRAARRVETSLGRIGGQLGALGRFRKGDRPKAGRLVSRTGLPVAGVGVAMLSVFVLLAMSGANAQVDDPGLFDTVDEAGRELLSFLTGGDGERQFEALGRMFFFFCAGIFGLVGVILVYQVVYGVVETGRRGLLGFTGWGIVRLVVAAVLMAPIPYGLSTGQWVVVGLARLGGDFAQSVWAPFSSTLLGDSKVVAPRGSEGARRTMLVNLMVVETCHAFAGPKTATAPVAVGSNGGRWPWADNRDKAVAWRYGVAQGRRGDEFRSLCGQVRFPGVELDGYRGEVARAHRQGLEEARVILRGVGEGASRTFVPEQADEYGRGLDESAVRTAIDQAYAAYSQTVDGVIEEAGKKWHGDAVEEVTSEEARDGSWTKAGSLFNRMASRISEFNWSAVSGPEVSVPAVELKEYDRRVFEVVVRLGEQIVRVGGGRELSLGNLSPDSGGSGGGASGALGTLIWGLFFDFEDVVQVGEDNPILDLAVIGDNLITYVLSVQGALMGMAMTSNIGDASFFGFRLPLDVFEAVWPVVDGMMTLLLNLMMIAGMVLAYGAPALPFIRFLFGMVAWLLDVVEAVVGVMVWLAVQVTPAADRGEFMTPTTIEGLKRLLGVVLRPTLMILGLVLGYFVFSVVIGLFNTVWLPQMRETAGASGPGLIGYAAYLAIYVMVAWGMLNACMRLIEALPEGVMEWIGGRMRPSTGADDVLRAGTGGAGRMGAPAPRGGGGARGGGAPATGGGGTPTN